MQNQSDFTEFSVHCTNTFDSPLGYQDIEIVKSRYIEAKIVFLVNGYPTNAHLQYNGLWGMYPSFKQINHYGNQSAL